jgi:DNA repair protein SbcC/Rad50
MIPVSLSLSNFLSYGKDAPLLDFTRFRVACLTGDNGHGKSALLDGITYALWGEARKSAHDRKPDAGLLRIGTDEMRVEFCFDLDEQRFRVIRSFRKTRRSGSVQLELQLFDPEQDSFRSLSEGVSATKTQERIVQLLSMDYETFINSAFIVQGKADEFTQKSSRQRKEILAEILGLSRYDRLQGLARARLQERTQQIQESQRRLGELDASLTDEKSYLRQLEETTAQLATLATSLEAEEKTLEQLREKRLERTQLQQQLEALGRERQQLDRRLRDLDEQQRQLEGQRQLDDKILSMQETIERDFATFQQLREQTAQEDGKLEQVRSLESAKSALEAKIQQGRHQVEQRREKWDTRTRDLGRRLAEFDTLFSQTQAIESAYSRLVNLRQQDGEMEKVRIRHEELQQERTTLQHTVDLQQQRLTSQRDLLKKRLDELRGHLGEWEALETRVSELETTIEKLRQQIEERNQLRDQGSGLRLQIDQLKEQLQREGEERENAREKVHILQASSAASCPLCGSRLDDTHRDQLGQELERQEREQIDLLDEHNRSLGNLEAELKGMREQYQRLEKETAPLEGLQQELAGLVARRTQLEEGRGQLRQIEDQFSVLEHQIAEETFASAQRRQLAQLNAECERLGYLPDNHAQLRRELQELLPVETDRTRLQDAKEQADRLRQELEEAEQKRTLAQQYIDDSLYAPGEQQELQATAARLEQLDYDPDSHREMRKQLKAFEGIVAQRERLIAARQRRDESEEAITRNQTELAAVRQRSGEMDDRSRALRERSDELEGVDQQFEQLAESLRQSGRARDQLLQRQGALQTQCDRCIELAAERKELRKELNENQREAWVFEQLDEAFGKNGIQALIIENAIPEIEKEANAILTRLTDNRIQISIESLRDLKKGGTRETLDIKISDEMGERSYQLYSGGEAFRTNFALRIALSRVLAMRAGTRLRTLIIDEGFGTQDSEGLEQLIEAIHEISKDFDKVLVVTHLTALKNAFPVQIEVTKHADIGSSFQIIDQS